ncbi:MAG: hypothetical protein E6G94_04390 [Alphaproteobacteria bacterium]|nr:MAG: hypothetical protein E6G94_04390 [Alphaproteobacteria bacterium]
MKKIVLLAAMVLLPAVASAQTPQPASTDTDKVKCRRIAETGSNARFQKICRKESEWRRLQDANRREASDMTNATGGMRTSG